MTNKKVYDKSYYEVHKDKIRAYQKAYRKSHLEQVKASEQKYRDSHRDQMREYREDNQERLKTTAKVYHETHQEQENARSNAYRATHREQLNAKGRIYNAKYRDKLIERRRSRRMEVLQHYGGLCDCCGESKFEFLQIDHINGNGNKHRKEMAIRGDNIYSWLKNNKYPSGFRILCADCNFSIGMYGYCPHNTATRNINASDDTN